MGGVAAAHDHCAVSLSSAHRLGLPAPNPSPTWTEHYWCCLPCEQDLPRGSPQAGGGAGDCILPRVCDPKFLVTRPGGLVAEQLG